MGTVDARVLLIEDKALSGLLTMRLLEQMGWRCDVATNKEDAVALFSAISYDVVFIGSQMDNGGGMEMAGRIRGVADDTRKPAIIALSEQDDGELLERCLEGGMDDLMHTPVVKSTLLKKLEGLGVKVPN